MVDRHHSVSQVDEPRARPRWGSLANERSLLDLLNGEPAHLQQPAALTLAPVNNANLYSRRHSAHTCPTTEEKVIPPILPPVPSRPPAVPKRMYVPPPVEPKQNVPKPQNPPPIPPLPRSRPLPPVPPARNPNPNSPNNFTKSSSSPKQVNKSVACAFEFNSKLAQEYGRMHHNSGHTAPKTYHKPQMSPATKGAQCNTAKMSMRQDSSVSSDSFSQTSSPSYTTKTMETPLLPPRTPIKQNGVINKIQHVEDEGNGNTTITKSASTPASLQTIVRFQNGSNMSLHHRIIKDMRRPSSHYVRRVRLRFRFAQVILNAIALLAIGGGMAAYFKAYPLEIHIVNNATVSTTNITPIVIYEKPSINPAPGICLPVIVSFCKQHKVPYNFTLFPNFMGHFGQPEAEQELEVYDAVVDVRCYELAALFLCSIFVPKCGPNGALVRPCRSLCHETKKRCGFFLDVFGLELPDYLMKCDFFPESADPNVCVGHQEVKEAKVRASRAVCPTGFQCDMKRCIPKDWQCDGHVDCKDQSDELNCEMCGAGMIHCGGKRCMSQEHMCDGIADCPWAQDERNCLRLSERNGDEGHGQLEVFRPDLQQWKAACIANWDTTSSPDLICSLLGYSHANGSRLLNDVDLNAQEKTLEYWKWSQNKQTNMLREFRSCWGKYRSVDITCIDYRCGKRRKTYAEKSERRNKRIVGGVASKPGDWPFLAALLGGPEEIFYCAGVLIADQWVLTASHCVGNHSDVSGWTIQLGITRRHAHSYYGQKMKVKRVVPHPQYNLGTAHDNDVALFQLASRVTFHEHLLPVCLPPANKELHPGTVCTVIGWGKKEDTGLSEYEPEINEVEVPVLNRDLCKIWLESKDLNVTDGMICAGYKEGGKDACQGDSGGPLLCRDENDRDRWFVGGIVSWGIKCAHPHLPGVYAYVPKYIPWILQQMKLYAMSNSNSTQSNSTHSNTTQLQ